MQADEWPKTRREILVRMLSAMEEALGFGPGVTWTCHVCGEERPDERISVCSSDISAQFGLPKGTMSYNVRHCNDRPGCIEGAKWKRIVIGGN